MGRRNKFKITIGRKQIELTAFNKNDALSCLYLNRMREKLPVTPAETSKWDEFKKRTDIKIKKVPEQIQVLVGPIGYCGWLEWFDVYDEEGLFCFLIGPYIKNGQPVHDNSSSAYQPHFDLVAKRFPYSSKNITIIAPQTPRNIIHNRLPLTHSVANALSASLQS
jgi:hypothetical protein